MQENKYYQIILMLLYNGVRISEFLNLKKENVHLDEQYFDVISSKTENGIRKVPIADKLLPFYRAWYESCPGSSYLLHTEDGKKFTYRNYYDSYWHPSFSCHLTHASCYVFVDLLLSITRTIKVPKTLDFIDLFGLFSSCFFVSDLL